MRKLVTNRWVHVYPGLVSRAELEEITGYWNHYLCAAS